VQDGQNSNTNAQPFMPDNSGKFEVKTEQVTDEHKRVNLPVLDFLVLHHFQ